MTYERSSLNLKLIEEKINCKFLELKFNLETQNKEIAQKLKQINNRIDTLSNQNTESIIISNNKKQIFDYNTFKTNLESINTKEEKDKKNLFESMIKQLKQYDNYYFKRINSLEKRIEEIKKDNDKYKEMIIKTNNEFNLIKIRFSETLDFIRDKCFWRQFISNLTEEHKKNKYKNKNKKNKEKDNDKDNNKDNNINYIYTPFNYYEYFGVEENKKLIDKGSNTSHYLNDKNSSVEVNNISINEQIKDKLKADIKFKTPNNMPNLDIMKNIKEINANNSGNIKQQNNSILNKTNSYKSMEENNENIINDIINNKNDKKNNKINLKKRAKVYEYIIRAQFLNNIDLNKNAANKSANLSEEYVQKQSKKIKKLTIPKNKPKLNQILPISVKNYLKKSRNESLNRFNVIFYKDIHKGNIEDLYYSQLKKDKYDNIASTTGINFRQFRNKELIKHIKNNSTNDLKNFPIIYRDKSYAL